MTPPFDRSQALASVPHGFFGRQGGHSLGAFSGNNVSLAVGDVAETVVTNRASVAESIGFALDKLCLLRQVHSASVHVVTKQPLETVSVEADALVTNQPCLLLGILTADCTPILLGDIEAGIIGAVHAGWRGAVSGVVGNTVSAMVELGARPDRIVAAIGPTISQRNYEVGPQFAAQLLELYPDAGNRHFKPGGGLEHFDLPGFVSDCLVKAGVATIEDLGLCTYAEPERFFSHRYATHQEQPIGRQIAVIGLT